MKKAANAVMIFLMAITVSTEASDQQAIEKISLAKILNMEITTASKKAESSSEAPGIITTITAREIKAFGANSLWDILNMVPSLQPTFNLFYGKNISALRGDLLVESDRHVLILINGRPIREAENGGFNNPIYNSFPVEIIDHIEIVRGPGSVLYGTNAFAGIINIITRETAEDWEMSFSGGGGSYGTYMSTLSGGMTSGNFKMTGAVRQFNQDGGPFRVDIVADRGPQSPPGSQGPPGSPPPADYINNHFGETRTSVFMDMTYLLGEGELDFSIFYSDNVEDYFGFPPTTDSTDDFDHERIFTNIGYTHRFSDTWEGSLNYSFNRHSSVATQSRDDSRLEWDSDGHLLEYTLTGSFFDEELGIVAGGLMDNRRGDNTGDYSTMAKEYDLTGYSGYLQLDYQVFDFMKLILGAQVNDPEDDEADIVGRACLIMNLWDERLWVKMLHGEAYRSPTPNENDGNPPADFLPPLGEADISPEKVATTDVQVSYYGEKLECGLTFFESNYEDLIVLTGSRGKGKYYANEGKMKVQGVEFELKAPLTDNLLLTGSAAYQDNKDDFTYSPEIMVKLGAYYQFGSGITAGIFNSYYEAPPASGEAGSKIIRSDRNPDAESVNLLSANISYKSRTKVPFEITLYVQNLLDEDYYFTAYALMLDSFPMGPGRTIYGKFSVSF
ncbi:MAG: TonB-dependent receptor [Desulfobacterales bacterium]|nr:TonB-dependent receptor [Desulfobacterales bacterium]